MRLVSRCWTDVGLSLLVRSNSRLNNWCRGKLVMMCFVLLRCILLLTVVLCSESAVRKVV